MAKNKYHYDLIKVLKEADEYGMPVRLIARHIYNNKVGLFDSNLSFEELYHSIRFYLWTQSNRPSSPFLKGEKRGCYRVRQEVFRQMELDFDKTQPCDTEHNPSEEDSAEDAHSALGTPLF